MATTGNLSDSKRKLLERFLRGEAARQSWELPIPSRVPGAPIPLAPVQQHLLLHAEMAAGTPRYTESVTVYFHGELDRGAFGRAFQEIVRRHEIWRTAFAPVDGDTVQVVYPESQIQIPYVDLTMLPEARREAEALRLATADLRRLMDPGVGPLLRPRLIKLGAQDFRCYLAIHHLIHDGVTIYGVFFPELVTIYNAFSQGAPSPLAEPRLQYADFALWQKRLLDNDAIPEKLEYWRRQFSGELPQLQLPIASAHSAAPESRGAIERFNLPRELAERLKQLSRDEGATLYMLLLAVFQVLLFRYSGQEDLIVGTLTDNRRRSEFQQMMGYFLNTLPVRTHPSGSLTFQEYLGAVKDVVLGSFANSEIPFDHLVRELQPKRESGRHPLFRVMFVMEPPPPPPLDPRWDLKQGEVSNGEVKFDLLFDVEERRDGLALRVHYDSSLFEAAAIRRMAGHWQTLLAGVVREPGTELARLPLLTASEFDQLDGWNATAQPVPRTMVHQMFEERAARKPHAIAAECDRMQLTYSELNRRANRLARRLREKGAGPDRVIGVCMERSSEMIVAVLAILKAGAAYLPLDPDLPERRLRSILEDSRALLLLTEDSLAENLSSAPVAQVLVDEGVGSGGNLEPLASPENLAYVIYTSGSTGKPKGVEIEHRSLTAYIRALRGVHGVSEGDRLLAVTAFSFDIATMDIFLSLVNGARLVVAHWEDTRDPARLRRLMEQTVPTVMNATPATWRGLVEAGWRGDKALRIMSGGEVLPPELAIQLLNRCGTLWNGYGPTETTIGSAFHQVTSVSGPIPIGGPIANTRFLVLDAHRQLVPVGVPGELYIGGTGLARGYLGLDELTRERFVEIPGQGRFYLTGDRVCWRADGKLECFGRTDNQVKIRGFRIEPEEIEAAILECPGVAAAAVKAWADASQHQSLTAYIVASVPTDAVRAFLGQRLPRYMLPTRWVVMDALPLTPNGKLDRKQLPQPDPEAAHEHYSAPSDEYQSRLIMIWETVLERTGIGVEDNFFDLGGHSLLVTKLLRRVEAEFGVRRNMADLFQAPTVREFSALFKSKSEAAPLRKIVPIQSSGTRAPLFWVNAGPKLRPLARRLGTQRPFLGVTVSREDQAALPERFSVEDLAAVLVRTIRERQPCGPYYLGGWCASGLLAYEAAAQLRAAGEEVGCLFLLDSVNPVHFLSISKGRLLASRVRLHARKLYRSSMPEIWRYIQARLKSRLSGLCPPEGKDANAWNERVYRATREYRPPACVGQLVLLQPSEDGLDVAGLAESWAGIPCAAKEIYTVSGSHETVMDEPMVADLANRISGCVAEAEKALRRLGVSVPEESGGFRQKMKAWGTSKGRS